MSAAKCTGVEKVHFAALMHPTTRSRAGFRKRNTVTTPNITTERQRAMIESLTRLAAERAREEVDAVARERERSEAATREHREARAAATEEFQRRHSDLIRNYRQAREAVLLEYESAGFTLAQEEDAFTARVAQEHAEVIEDAKNLAEHRGRKIEVQFREKELVPQKEVA